MPDQSLISIPIWNYFNESEVGWITVAPLFQFLYGIILTHIHRRTGTDISRFQFLYGIILTYTHLRGLQQEAKFQFLYGIILTRLPQFHPH